MSREAEMRDANREMNNPKGVGPVHGGDWGDPMTVAEFVDPLGRMIDEGLGRESINNFIDREFILGTWAHELGDRDPELLRNIRGIFVCLYEAGRLK